MVQMAVGLPVADKSTCRFVFPSPANDPDAVKVRPLSVKVGPLFTWTLFANANVVMRQTIISADSNAIPNLRIVFSFANTIETNLKRDVAHTTGYSTHYKVSIQRGLFHTL